MIKSIIPADLSACEEANSFLQSAMWGRFKSRFGWQAKAFTVEWDPGGTKHLLTLSRRIAPGISMCYIPWGPELPATFPVDPIVRSNAAAALARALKPFLSRAITFIRFDLPWFDLSETGQQRGGSRGAENIWNSPPEQTTEKNLNLDTIKDAQHLNQAMFRNSKDYVFRCWAGGCVGGLYTGVYTRSVIRHPGCLPFAGFLQKNSRADLPAPFTRAAADIQPPDTVLVDLTLSCNDILAAMKPKWRYNIGLAEKRNVTVSCNGEQDPQNLDIFYRLLTETSERDGIAIHSIEYYRALFEESPQLHLYSAEHEGDTLAAIVVLFRGQQATYLYGASANIKRNLMAPYALQWKAMQDAKENGCTQYDLFGIPPNEDPDHPMAGLYRFKTGFGGTIVHRPGSWDYPCKPALYTLFRSAEHLRKKIRDRRKHR